MFRAFVVLLAALVIVIFASSALAAEPRTGPLDEPRPHLIVDIFDSEKEAFAFTGTWEEWTPPEGVTYAIFELFGGAGESGEAQGHVAAGVDLQPGEPYMIRVGGGGEDTSAVSIHCLIPEWWECGGTVIAAGGDSTRSWNQTNLVPTDASAAIEHWEGGGPDSELESGRAIVHYWLPEDERPPLDEETPPDGDTSGLDAGTDTAAQLVQPGVVPKPCAARQGNRRKAPKRTRRGRPPGIGLARAVGTRRRGSCHRMDR